MASLSFATQVQDWVEKVPEAAEAVFKQSTKEVVRQMQKPVSKGGRMRVDTGFLRASLLGSATAMPTIQAAARPASGAAYTYNEGQIEAVIMSATLNDTLYFGYTASYAAFREYGARGQAPDAFVRLAAQNWQMIVNTNAAKVKAAFGL